MDAVAQPGFRGALKDLLKVIWGEPAQPNWAGWQLGGMSASQLRQRVLNRWTPQLLPPLDLPLLLLTSNSFSGSILRLAMRRILSDQFPNHLPALPPSWPLCAAPQAAAWWR